MLSSKIQSKTGSVQLDEGPQGHAASSPREQQQLLLFHALALLTWEGWGALGLELVPIL